MERNDVDIQIKIIVSCTWLILEKLKNENSKIKIYNNEEITIGNL